jgi:hypothetical protein
MRTKEHTQDQIQVLSDEELGGIAGGSDTPSGYWIKNWWVAEGAAEPIEELVRSYVGWDPAYFGVD